MSTWSKKGYVLLRRIPDKEKWRDIRGCFLKEDGKEVFEDGYLNNFDFVACTSIVSFNESSQRE